MILLALDCSTKSTGYSIFKEKELIKYGCIQSTSSDLIKRIHIMVDTICGIIKEYNIDTIVMEEVIPDSNKNRNTFKALMYLQATMIIMLHDNYPKVKVELVYPGTWRASCGIKTGRGVVRATLKEADIRFVQDTYGFTPANDDIADSISLGHSYLHPYVDKGAF